MSALLLDDTIAAISTPPGRGAVGIVRLSGPSAATIGETLFRGRRPLTARPFTALRGVLVEPDAGETIDDVLALYFPNPKSFTGEDVVEFHCHGAPVVLQRVVQAAIRSGARAARPGEFTMRAFLNGRINLTQAEGIRDLIHAQTTYQANLALRQAQGALSTRLQPAKEILLGMIVHLESAVEFVEENLDTDTRDTIIRDLTRLEIDLSRLEQSFQAGHLVREGMNLAVIGRPNVGKSSLFNALLDSDRAIVTDLPGTTRDTLAESVAVGGVPVRLVDTAGIRETADHIERIGVERSYVALSEADVVLLVLDAAQGTGSDDDPLFDLLRDRNAIVVLNKIDLPHARNGIHGKAASLGLPLVEVSAKTRVGLDDLRSEIRRTAAGTTDSQSDLLITDARHAEALREAVAALGAARTALVEGWSEEVPLAGLHRALNALGEITGEVTVEQIFDRVFSTFCIGK